MNDSKAWWQSKGVWGGLVAFAAAVIGPLVGVSLDAIEQGEAVDIIVAATGIGGSVLAFIGRIRAKAKIGGAS